MANINSQKKRIRQDKKRNLRNKSIKTELKTILKSVEDSSVENKSNALKTLILLTQKALLLKISETETNLKFQNSNNFFIEIKYLLEFSISYPY